MQTAVERGAVHRARFALANRGVRNRIGTIAWSIARAALLLGMSYIILFPILVKISSSFMSLEDMFDSSVNWIPRRPTLEHYRDVFYYMDYPRTLLNSIVLSGGVSILQVVSCMLVGYGLARFDFPGRRILFGCVIFTLIVPPELLLVPLYINWRFFNLGGLIPGPGWNLLNSQWPFYLMAATGTGIKNGLFIYIMRQFFKGMPKSLEEAAYVDGAGPIRTFFSVMMPNAKAPMLVTFVLSFAWQWNDYFYTTAFYQSASDLLTTAFLRVNTAWLEGYRQIHGMDPPWQIHSLISNTAALFYIAPLLVMFAFLQRYFMRSVERSGIVG